MKGRLLHPNSCVVQHITVKPAKSAGMSQTIWEAVIGGNILSFLGKLNEMFINSNIMASKL